MENLGYRSGVDGAGQMSRSMTAQLSRLCSLRRFLRAMWAVHTSRHALRRDCVRCGHPVVDGIYCFHCGYVRPRTTQRRGPRGVADWLLKAR